MILGRANFRHQDKNLATITVIDYVFSPAMNKTLPDVLVNIDTCRGVILFGKHHTLERYNSLPLKHRASWKWPRWVYPDPMVTHRTSAMVIWVMSNGGPTNPSPRHAKPKGQYHRYLLRSFAFQRQIDWFIFRQNFWNCVGI